MMCSVAEYLDNFISCFCNYGRLCKYLITFPLAYVCVTVCVRARACVRVRARVSTESWERFCICCYSEHLDNFFSSCVTITDYCNYLRARVCVCVCK